MYCKTKDCTGIANAKYLGYCQACYKYFKSGKKIYPIPNDGEIETNECGEIICHECGKAFAKLGNHIFNRHNMSINDYKDKHKLYHKEKLTSTNYQETMRQYTTDNYDKVVSDNLVIGGKSTRFNVGMRVKGAGKHIKR